MALSSLVYLLTSQSLVSLLLPLLLIVFLTRRRSSRQHQSSQWNLPPGPKKLPIIGNLHQMGLIPHRSLHALSLKHGPVMSMQLAAVPSVVISSAKMAKEIMKTHDLSFASRPDIVTAKLLSYGASDVAFSPYGENWRNSRKLFILELLSLKSVQSLRSIREEEVSDVIGTISRSAGAVNLSELLLSLTTNIVCRAAMGERYIMGDYSMSRLSGIIKETEALVTGFFFADFLPTLKWLDSLTGMNARLKKNFRNMDCFFEEMIQKHIHRKSDDSSPKDLIDSLLDIQENGNEPVPVTNERIKGILMNVIIAGTDTTWSVLVWAMVELMRNPEAMAKAQQEVRQLVASRGTMKVEEGDVDQLEYLQLVVKETLRLHMPIPLLVARSCREHCKIGGFDVLPKTIVSVNAWAIARDPDNWENPEEFRPERFANRDVDYRGQDFELTPFGSGRRICPGTHFAIATINLGLANLLYSFDWEMPSGLKAQDMDTTETFGITAHIKFDLCLVARPYPACH